MANLPQVILERLTGEAKVLSSEQKRMLSKGLEQLIAELESDAAPATETMEGQIVGYWFSPNDVIPPGEPAYLPTGSVLPRKGEQLRDGATVLNLIRLENVVSALGSRTLHVLALVRSDLWRALPLCAPDAAMGHRGLRGGRLWRVPRAC